MVALHPRTSLFGGGSWRCRTRGGTPYEKLGGQERERGTNGREGKSTRNRTGSQPLSVILDRSQREEAEGHANSRPEAHSGTPRHTRIHIHALLHGICETLHEPEIRTYGEIRFSTTSSTRHPPSPRSHKRLSKKLPMGESSGTVARRCGHTSVEPLRVSFQQTSPHTSPSPAIRPALK